MELFDFYKLLNIPVGTPIEDVKKAYVLKVHQYSEAFKQGNEKAVEFIQIITNGYNLMSDPEKKRVYDLMLLNMYLKHGNSELNQSFYKKYGSSDRNPIKDEGEFFPENPTELVEEMLTDARREQISREVRTERLMLLLSAGLFIVVSFLFDLIYWSPYTDGRMVSFVFLGAAYLMIMFWSLKKLYRYFEVRSLLFGKKSSFDRWILLSFLVMFFAIPSLALRLENWKRDFHLRRHSATVQADNFMLEDQWLTVEYTVNGKGYKQSYSLGNNVLNFRKSHYERDRFLIRYSTTNPKIIRIEEVD